jgi:hypothetical protein
MQKLLRSVAAAAALLTATASTASAQFTVFTDRIAFQNALGSYFVDTFFNNAINTPGASVSATSGSFGSGRFNDQVNDGNTPNTIWTFLNGTYGFGGEWDLAGPGGLGTGIAVTVNFLGGGSASVGTEIPRTTQGFWGFVSTSAMADVLLAEGTQSGGVDTYNFDDMTTGTNVVPEPSTYALMAAGLAGLYSVSRRRKA